jgi:hypothetical protein
MIVLGVPQCDIGLENGERCPNSGLIEIFAQWSIADFMELHACTYKHAWDLVRWCQELEIDGQPLTFYDVKVPAMDQLPKEFVDKLELTQ